MILRLNLFPPFKIGDSLTKTAVCFQKLPSIDAYDEMTNNMRRLSQSCSVNSIVGNSFNSWKLIILCFYRSRKKFNIKHKEKTVKL